MVYLSKKTLPYNFRISPVFSEADYLNIEKLAAQKGCTKAELVRELTLNGLKTELTLDNLDFICKILRQELKNIQRPEVDRLASLIAKTCIMSATSSYLTAEALASFVPPGRQRDIQEAFDSARLKAIQYTKSKIDFD